MHILKNKQARARATIIIAAATMALTTLALWTTSSSPARAQEPVKKPTIVKGGPPWLGVVADRDYKKGGLKVRKVLETSPADTAQIQPGEIIKEANGQAISSVRDLKLSMRTLRSGDTLEMRLVKTDGSEREVSVLLGNLPTQRELLVSQLMGRKAPDFSGVVLPVGDQRSRRIGLEELEGKPVIIDFWATWCRPCKPYQQQVHETATRHKGKIHALSVSAEKTGELMPKLKDAPPRAYLNVRDPKGIMHDDYFVRAFPLVIILDEDLIVRKVITGADSPLTVEKTIQSMLNASKPEQ